MTPRQTSRPRLHLASVLAAAALAACRPTASSEPEREGSDAHAAAIARWHAERDAELRDAQGWLALAGLTWLSEGEYRLGADPGADIAFPGGAPASVGTLTLQGGELRLRVAPGVDARLDGAPITEATLRPDRDRVQLGERFTFLAIARGGRIGLRLYDAGSPARREFAGIPSFPVAPAWRVRARFEPYDPPRSIVHPTVVGDTQAEVPGVAVFTLGGVEHRLTPILEQGPKGPELLFVFRDRTSGVETYTGGRFLIAELPQDGALELDFNRAHNPPCAFTAYATCPLPREENHLKIRVEAGEKTPAEGH